MKIEISDYVRIDDAKEYINIRGDDIHNPLLLVLHGGPGSPLTPYILTYQPELEKYYTVVNLDQRNAGKTYYANNPENIYKTLTFQRMVDDIWILTNILLNQFKKDKIILMAHSWGTAIGSVFIQEHPETISAYIGIGQMIDFKQNEKAGYDMAVQKCKADGDGESLNKLTEISSYPGKNIDECLKNLITVREIQTRHGIAASDFSQEWKDAAKASPDWKVYEEYYTIDSIKAQYPLLKYLFEEYNLNNYEQNYKLPIFYISGENDYQTPISLVKDYYEKINAPKKELFTVKDAGHIPMMDNKSEFIKIVTENIYGSVYIN